MIDFYPENERAKRRYLTYLTQARGVAVVTADNSLRAIHQFEQWSKFRRFNLFRSKHAIAYRRFLLSKSKKRATETSARSTVHSSLLQLKSFFSWLASQRGYQRDLDARDAEYFNLDERQKRIATSRPPKEAPSLDQAVTLVRSMPGSNDIELRDRALVALLVLTGARVSALASLKVKHVRKDRLGIDQDAREVKTKLGRSFTTYFFPVGDDVREVFLSYVDHLLADLDFRPNDPLFPSTLQRHVGLTDQFAPTGLSRKHWQTADPVRRIVKQTAERANVPYFSPHTMRNMLAHLALTRCRTPEDMKAWSQNLGHLEVMTTIMSYGHVPTSRQSTIIAGLGPKTARRSAEERDLLTALQELVSERASFTE